MLKSQTLVPRGFIALFGLLCCCLTACNRTPSGPKDVTPDDFVKVRDYGWDTTVMDPQAAWSPNDYRVLARSIRGLMLLSEGSGQQHVYRTADQTEVFHPVWISGSQFVYGPDPTPKRDEDGRILLPNYGLKVGTVKRGELSKLAALSEVGYRPKPWGEVILASKGDDIVTFTNTGEEDVLDKGFLPEAQRQGEGICFQTVPVLFEDYWTGKQPPGELIIRWNEDQVDVLKGAVQAKWTAWGGLVAIVLQGAPPKEGPWWSAGTHLVYLEGPGKEPRIIKTDVHSAHPHPTCGVVACVDKAGQVVIVDLDGLDATVPPQLVSPVGRKPQWSFDGLRLLVDEPHEDDDKARHLHVYVFQVNTGKAD